MSDSFSQITTYLSADASPHIQGLSRSERTGLTESLERLFSDLVDVVRPSVFVEVGAHEASFSREMSERYPSAKIIALEANPVVFEYYSVKLSGYKTLEYLNLAASDRSGEISLFVPEKIGDQQLPTLVRMASLNPLSTDKAVLKEVKVPTSSLNQLLESSKGRHCCLWIDVEGAIAQVLAGAEQVLAETDLLLCELESGSVWKDQALAVDVIQVLRDKGLIPVARDFQAAVQFNVLFIRESLLKQQAIQALLSGYVDQVEEFARPVLEDSLQDYLKFCKTTLCDSAPDFNMTLIADTGLERGLLQPKEAERLKVFSIFPDRIAEVLNVSPNFAPEATKVRSLCERAMVQLNRYSFADAQPAALELFQSVARPAPEIELTTGGSAWHYVRNFSKLSWSDAGIIPLISDQAGYALHQSFGGASPVELGHSFLGVVEGSSVYIHWLLDTLPRLLLAKNAGEDFERFDHILLATAQSGFHQYCLSKLGISMEKVVTRQVAGDYFKTTSFVTTSAPRQHSVTHPIVYQQVADFLKSTADFNPISSDATPAKIYVSRDKSARRKVVNEEELVHALHAFGYRRVFLEDLAQPEVIHLFGSAQCIVAPHGAGLANLIFANPGTKVIEMFSGHISFDYWIISSQLQLQYGVFQATPPGQQFVEWESLQDLPFFERNALNMHVNCQRLGQLLESAGMT